MNGDDNLNESLKAFFGPPVEPPWSISDAARMTALERRVTLLEALWQKEMNPGLLSVLGTIAVFAVLSLAPLLLYILLAE